MYIVLSIIEAVRTKIKIPFLKVKLIR